MAVSHANCDHPRTPKARQACRVARRLGAETPAKARTITFPSDDTSGALKTTTLRAGAAKRRLRNTLDVLSRAIEQGHPKHVRITHAVPGLDINTSTWGDVVEVADQHLVLVKDDGGLELNLRYGMIMTIYL